MADVLDTTVTKSAEPEATPAAETTPTGQEPEGKEAKPESKFLQRLGKLLGIGDDGGRRRQAQGGRQGRPTAQGWPDLHRGRPTGAYRRGKVTVAGRARGAGASRQAQPGGAGQGGGDQDQR